MDPTLSQDEIDRLFDEFGEGAVADEAAAKTAVTYDFRRPDRIPKEQLRSIHLMHDFLARNLASAGAGASGAVSVEPPASEGSAAAKGDVNQLLALGSSAQHNLAMLLEVELELSISFGRTELPLQEILQLASGSIVELNRSVTDPVDVMVNNCVIARGDVVVVDGNYGIRVTEIVSRQERIRSIF